MKNSRIIEFAKRIRDSRYTPWVIVFSTLAICIPMAVYGYGNWKAYHSWNLEAHQAVKPALHAASSDWIDWYDLKAQQEMSEWAYALLWIGIIGLVTSVAGIGFIFLNLRSLNEQNRIAQETGEAQTRPFLAVSQNVLLTESHADSLGRWFRLSFTIRNAGTTPAVTPRISIVLFLDSEFTNPPDRRNPIFVSILDERPTISPNQEHSVSAVFSNAGLPQSFDEPPSMSISEDGTIQIYDEVKEKISKDGNMNMCLQIKLEYTDISGLKRYSVGLELEPEEGFTFRRRLHEVKFNPERSLGELSLSDSELLRLRYNCPSTWIFGNTHSPP